MHVKATLGFSKNVIKEAVLSAGGIKQKLNGKVKSKRNQGEIFPSPVTENSFNVII